MDAKLAILMRMHRFKPTGLPIRKKQPRDKYFYRRLAVLIAVPLLTISGIYFGSKLKSSASGASSSYSQQDAQDAASDSPYNYYVSPGGNDLNSGLSVAKSFKTIQRALNSAKPGTTIHIAPGQYHETLTTKISGTAKQPIILLGGDKASDAGSSHQTVLYGTGRIINVNHSYYTFAGFAVDGQEKLASDPYPTDPSVMNAYKDRYQSLIKDGRLIYVGSADKSKNLTGVHVTNMLLQGAGGECVRFRNDSFGDSVTDSVIRYCGLYAKSASDRFNYHNGEGVYIGTSPKSSDQPAYLDDSSHDILVADNTIDTYGSECVDIKESSHNNTVRHNVCQDNLEPLQFDGSNLEVRGDHNTIIDNTINSSAGWNLKLVSDSSKYDKGGNDIQNNSLKGAASDVSVYIKQSSSKITACGNSPDGSVQGFSQATFTKACSNTSATP